MDRVKTLTVTCPISEDEAVITVKHRKVRTLSDAINGYTSFSHYCSLGSIEGCLHEKCPFVEIN